MEIRRLPAAKVMTSVSWAIIVLAASLWLVSHCWKFPDLTPAPKVNEKITVAILRSEALTFLVTRRTVTQIIIEHQESSWLGEWRGALWATVDFRYGVNLKKLRDEDLRRDGKIVWVKLPEPELLDFSVRGTIGHFDKSTAAAKLDDLLHNGHRRHLESQLEAKALEFAHQHDLMPSRQELVRQLDEAAALLMGRTDTQLRFE